MPIYRVTYIDKRRTVDNAEFQFKFTSQGTKFISVASEAIDKANIFHNGVSGGNSLELKKLELLSSQ